MPTSAFSLLSEGVQKAIYRLGWDRLHQIQTEAISILLTSDNDLIISAPTAGGKTEAAFLPILSTFTENPTQVVVYVSPLKALINDQWGRLDSLCSDLDVPVRRWHGDVSATEKRDFREHPRGIILITPESLESNFVNYGRSLSRIYAQTTFVVVDELHAFIDGVRGMHLRSLISRLCAAAGCNPRLIGLSATLGEPTAAQHFLRPDEPSRVKLITETGSGREIFMGLRAYLERPRMHEGEKLARRLTPEETAQVADSILGDVWCSDAPLAPLGPNLGLAPTKPLKLPTDALDDIADDVAAHFQEGTNLVFGNSRSTLEELADILHEHAREGKWRHDPFCVHHGSLSKPIREEVEEKLRSRTPTTALCTSTLELGIDIGNVRTVGQIDPPWSVAALVQRLGRSGRRAGEPSRMRIYARDETPKVDSTLTNMFFPRLLRSTAVVELMLEKWTEPNSSERTHLSTMAHQLMSILRQTGGIAVADIYRILCLKGPFRAVNQSLFARVLRGLGEKGIVEQIPTGELILAPAGEKVTAEKDFYAAFASNEIYQVRMAEEIVGEMPADSVPPVGQCFILGGRRWEVDEVGMEEKTVWVKPTRQRVPPLFSGDGGDIDARVFEKMRELLLNDDMPSFLDHSARLLLISARKAARASGAASTSVVAAKGMIIWFPWTGSKAFRTLRLMLKTLEIDHDFDSLSIRLKGMDIDGFNALRTRLTTQTFNPVELASNMEVKCFDKFDEFFPENVIDEINARDRLDCAAINELLKPW